MLEIKSLNIALFEKGILKKSLVQNVSINVPPARIVAIVGESGSGKSLTAYSVLNLMPSGNLRIVGGEVFFKNSDILTMREKELRQIRGAEIFMIPQDPLTALNPVLSIGEQIGELFKYHTNASKKEIREKTLALLEKVKIDNPEYRIKTYPHQLSGGQRQRVLIAMSLALNPSLIIADEPTTAIDVSLQVEILELFLQIKNEMNKSLIIITHDFGIVSMVADHIYVMYGGRIVEEGTKKEILENPLHPYTMGLLKSVPSLNSVPKTLLPVIKGYTKTSGYFCPFYERCEQAEPNCKDTFEYKCLTKTHFVLCRKG